MLLLVFLAAAFSQAQAPADQARDLIARVADRTGGFVEHFDAARGSVEGGSRMESRARHRSRDFQVAVQKMREVFDAKREKNDPAIRSQVGKTLALASDINQVMLGNRFNPELRREWESLRGDLNLLAQIYSLPIF